MNIAPLLLSILRVLLGLSLGAYSFFALFSVRAAWLWAQVRSEITSDWMPPVTIIKPVCGTDAEAYENFKSYCTLDYPADRMQIIFGALDPDDSALVLARQLQAEYPSLDIGVISEPERAPQGFNRKVCNLSMMMPYARHDLFIFCDSDTRVTPDYIRRVIAPFRNQEENGASVFRSSGFPNKAHSDASGFQSLKTQIPASPPDTAIQNRGVGLVTSPYFGKNPQGSAAIMEALGMGADFIPGTLVSRALEGVGFALGSTIVMPRHVLDEIGGIASLRDDLADDFLMGQGARKAGYKVVLSDYLTATVLGREEWGVMWSRRLRWARTLRACRPAGYAGAFVTYGFALSLLFLGACGFSSLGWAVVGAILALRLITAWWIARAYTHDPNIGRFLALIPLSDLLAFALYIASFCGSKVVWRGQAFRLLRNGKLESLHKSASEASHN